MDLLTSELKEELIAFTQNLVRIKGYSGQEERIVRFIEQKMKDLGYDDVTVDSMGNVIGRIGTGKKSILLDSHADTVCILTRKPKTSYLPAEIEFSVLVGYYKEVLFSRKIRILSALGGKAT